MSSIENIHEIQENITTGLTEISEDSVQVSELVLCIKYTSLRDQTVFWESLRLAANTPHYIEWCEVLITRRHNSHKQSDVLTRNTLTIMSPD